MPVTLGDKRACLVSQDAVVFRCVHQGEVYSRGTEIKESHLCIFEGDNGELRTGLKYASGQLRGLKWNQKLAVFGTGRPVGDAWRDARLGNTDYPKYTVTALEHWESCAHKASSKKRKVWDTQAKDLQAADDLADDMNELLEAYRKRIAT